MSESIAHKSVLRVAGGTMILSGLSLAAFWQGTKMLSQPPDTTASDEQVRQIDQRIRERARAAQERFRSMSPAEHLAAARTALSQGYDPGQRVGGNLPMAERHLLIIPAGTVEFEEARRLLEEVTSRRERAAEDSARNSPHCRVMVRYGSPISLQLDETVRQIASLPRRGEMCGGRFAVDPVRHKASITLSAVHRLRNLARQAVLVISFDWDRVPLGQQLGLEQVAWTSSDTGSERPDALIAIGTQQLLQVGDGVRILGADGYGRQATGTRGTFSARRERGIWSIRIAGELGQEGGTSAVSIDAEITFRESAASRSVP